MDTTPKYIKMCVCSEIQDIIPRMIDDTGIKYIDGAAHILKYHIGLGKLIWLPRQDQLQEMVSDRLLGLQTVCAVLHDFSITEGEGLQFTMNDGSMEQLWLAYVMHEKYGKIWDDKKEEWVHL